MMNALYDAFIYFYNLCFLVNYQMQKSFIANPDNESEALIKLSTVLSTT